MFLYCLSPSFCLTTYSHSPLTSRARFVQTLNTFLSISAIQLHGLRLTGSGWHGSLKETNCPLETHFPVISTSMSTLKFAVDRARAPTYSSAIHPRSGRCSLIAQGLGDRRNFAFLKVKDWTNAFRGDWTLCQSASWWS